MPDGAFEAFPVNNWYNFMPLAKGRMLTAEEEWERRNPVRNHLCIKQQPRWKDQEEDEKEKPGARKPLSCTSVTWRVTWRCPPTTARPAERTVARAPRSKRRGHPARGFGRRRRDQTMRPLRSVIMVTSRARRWTTCPPAAATPRRSWRASPRSPSRRRAPRAWTSRA